MNLEGYIKDNRNDLFHADRVNLMNPLHCKAKQHSESLAQRYLRQREEILSQSEKAEIKQSDIED